MAVSAVRERFLNLLATVGRSTLHSNFPDDFEYYAVSFELTDYKDDVVDLLVFPILPSTLGQAYQPNINIKRSGAGINTLFNSSFQPFNISLSGTFGRKFRFILGQDVVNGVAFKLKLKGDEFDAQVKTGYGTTKILQRILENSLRTDENQRPFHLYFHNLAFNTSVAVEVVSYSFSQDERGSNMMWNYNIALRAVAPAASVRSNENQSASLKNILKTSILQKSLDTLLKTSVEQFTLGRNKLING